MTAEQEILLSLLRAQLTGTVAKLPSDVSPDWTALMRESMQQTVALTAFDAVSKATALPEDIKAAWRQKAFITLANNSRLNTAQTALVHLLEQRQIPYVIIKGTVSAYHYPHPELRTLGDIDFFVEPSYVQETTELLVENGYEQRESDHSCHIGFEKGAVGLEMHFAFTGMEDPKVGPAIRAYLADMMRQPKRLESFDSGVTPFDAPTHDRHGLLMLLHMQQHLLNEGMGLRHLCDWAAFVHRTADKPFWDEKLLPLLEAIGLKRFAAAMTKMCHLYLGTRCPVWAEDVSKDVCAGLMQDILDGGNFGRKDKRRVYSGRMISQRNGGKWRSLWDTLHRSTADMHPIVRKIKPLHPLLDGYRACRYLVLVACKRRPTFEAYAPQVDERKNLYAALHIFETKE